MQSWSHLLLPLSSHAWPPLAELAELALGLDGTELSVLAVAASLGVDLWPGVPWVGISVSASGTAAELTADYRWVVGRAGTPSPV